MSAYGGRQDKEAQHPHCAIQLGQHASSAHNLLCVTWTCKEELGWVSHRSSGAAPAQASVCEA